MGSHIQWFLQAGSYTRLAEIHLYLSSDCTMFDTLADCSEFVIFILQWFIGWLMGSPHVLVIIVLLGWATIITCRFLNQMTMPAILSSPKLSLMLLVVLFMLSMRGYNTNQELLGLQNDLDNAHWRIRQGAQHRIDLLKQIETAGKQGRTRNIEEEEEVELEANPLDGCLHVFLSAGPSSALPIRALYEPDHFPLSPAQAIYEKFFGKPDQRNEKEICSIVFDPNPTSALEKISVSYSTCGIRVLVIKAAAGHIETTTRTDDAQEEVEVVKIAKYITTVVKQRTLPAGAAVTKPRVVMNLGGSQTTQLKVIPDMLVTGALGKVDMLLLEGKGDPIHRQMVDSIVALGELTASEGMEHQFEVEEVDDQTYPEYEKVPVKSC